MMGRAYSVADIIEQRELQIECRLCGWTGSRTLRWLAANRDTTCPTCQSVIVLNTSELRRSVEALRRQVTTLHQQLVGAIPAPSDVMRRDSPRLEGEAESPQARFALCQVYAETTGRQANYSRTARKSRR